MNMSDIDAFFKGQQERMDTPDEDFDEYLLRVSQGQRSIQSTERVDIYSTLPVYPALSKDLSQTSVMSLINRDQSAAFSESHGCKPHQGVISCNKRQSSETRSSPDASASKRRRVSEEQPGNMPNTSCVVASDAGVNKSISERRPRLCPQNGKDRNDEISRENLKDALPRTSTTSLLPTPSRNDLTDPDIPTPHEVAIAYPSSGLGVSPDRSATRHFKVASENQEEHRSSSLNSAVSSAHGGQAAVPQTPSGAPTLTNKHHAPADVRASSSSHAMSGKSTRQGKVLKISKPTGSPSHPVDSSSVTTPAGTATGGIVLSIFADNDTSSSIIAKTTKRKSGPAAVKKEKSKKKHKELITPLEYAQRLRSKVAEIEAKGKSPLRPYLKGMRIFYFGGDMKYAGDETRGRMDFIIKHGGTLVPVYDPAEVTHIVTEAQKRPLLRALGLRKLDEIPMHIPTVKWSWILSGLRRSSGRRIARDEGKGKSTRVESDRGRNDMQQEDEDGEVTMDYEIMHASFKERLDAGPRPWMNRTGKPQHAQTSSSHVRNSDFLSGRQGPATGQDNGELSGISEFTQDKIDPKTSLIFDYNEPLPSPPSSPTPSHRVSREDINSNALDANTSKERSERGELRTRSAQDPLANFYALAKAERETELLHGRSSDDDSDDGENSIQSRPQGGISREAGQKRARLGFLCDTKGGGQRARCVNQDVIDKIEELMELHKAKPSEEDQWRVFSYGKAIRALRSYPERIQSYEQARAIRGIGDKTAQKIMEILETGGLRRIAYEKTDDIEAINAFQGIYGVGRSIAFKWYANGCRTLDDVKARKGGIKLSPCQEIGLKHYADINSRMPRSEAADIFDMIKSIALSIEPKLFIEIMGSYRRGKADCGDIDILITRPTDDGKTHHGILRQLLGELHRRGILTEDLSLPDSFDDLELVYRGLCRKDDSSRRRRIDFLTVPYKSRGAALLYYTGDDIFNRSLRLKANKMGYSLNQRGLFAGVIRNPSDKRQKLNEGNIIASESEREILDILGVPWQEPHERVRG